MLTTDTLYKKTQTSFSVSPTGHSLDQCTFQAKTMDTYKRIFENAVEGIFLTTPQGQYIDVNPALAKIYGFTTPEEVIEYFADIKQQLYIIPSRRDEFIHTLEKYGKVTGFESQVRIKNGETIWITENARAVYGENGVLEYYEGTVMDISDRKSAESKLEIQQTYFSQLFSNSPQAIAIIDKHRNVVRCNRGFEELFGYTTTEVANSDLQQIIVPDDLAEESGVLWSRILSGQTIECETQRIHRDGYRIPVSLIGFPIFSHHKIHGITYVYQDISERKSFEQQILHQAYHDELTGLPNRSFFNKQLHRALDRREKSRKSICAILLLDLDKFKSVNDTLGHPAGDDMLIEVSKRLAACVRMQDTVSRLGGDEFAVILENFSSEEAVLQIAARIHSALCEPFLVESHTIRLQASIGILPDIQGYTSPDDILRDVDIAMYRAKHQRKSLVIFDTHMHLELLDATSFENELRDAVMEKKFSLHYQPMLDVDSQRLIGFEALARWNHPTRGMVPPDQFIPIAEETGLITRLGEWVIEEACRTLYNWQKMMEETNDLTMSVNVSVRQLAQPGLVEYFSSILKKYALKPKSLRVEITESIIMNDASYSMSELNALRELGVQIALDDFGTGYSSLSYIHKLPIDVLKIDRSFICNLEQQEENTPIVQSIITLAKVLGITVVAEGVETTRQLSKLRELRCDTAQGYLFSPPVDARNAAKLIRQQGREQRSPR